jgi:hypothetical protein
MEAVHRWTGSDVVRPRETRSSRAAKLATFIEEQPRNKNVETQPVPSVELSAEHMTNLDLVRTVSLPSPFPATARVFVVRHPGAKQPSGKEGRPKFHIKVVQTINESYIVTRYVSPDYVRQIRLQPEKGDLVRPVAISGEQVHKDIEAILWEAAAVGSQEAELYPGRTGVVIVPEDAPVILRHEQFVPAATSLEPAFVPRLQCPHHC